MPPFTLARSFGSRLDCERVHSFVPVNCKASWSSYHLRCKNHVEPYHEGNNRGTGFANNSYRNIRIVRIRPQTKNILLFVCVFVWGAWPILFSFKVLASHLLPLHPPT